MDRHQFADSPGSGGASIGRGFNRADIAADDDADQARADEFFAGKHHIGGFYHGVGRFDGGYQSFCFNQAQGLHASSSFSCERNNVAQIGGAFDAACMSASKTTPACPVAPPFRRPCRHSHASRYAGSKAGMAS